MRHFASPEFWDLFNALPLEVQRLARQNYDLLRSNLRHPSLRFKRVRPYWSVRVGKHYRALGTDEDDGILWGWIGSHAEYNKLIR